MTPNAAAPLRRRTDSVPRAADLIVVNGCFVVAILPEARLIVAMRFVDWIMQLAVCRYGANTMMVSSPHSHRPALTE